MGGRIDTILMSVKFGDDPISSLDFSFTGVGVPLRSFQFLLNSIVFNLRRKQRLWKGVK